MSIRETIVADFLQEAANTRKVLAAVPEDKLGWKPHEKSMSLGQLAGHIAETPEWVESMMGEVFDMASLEGEYKPFVPTTHAELMTRFEDNVRGFEKYLDGRDDAFLSEIWTMKQGEQILMSSPRAAVIRSIAIHHLIHHRGQLTVYLRLLDVPVPGTYGPTADDPNF